jgi:hypothetical protein
VRTGGPERILPGVSRRHVRRNQQQCLLSPVCDRSGEADGAGADGYRNNEQPAGVL